MKIDAKYMRTKYNKMLEQDTEELSSKIIQSIEEKLVDVDSVKNIGLVYDLSNDISEFNHTVKRKIVATVTKELNDAGFDVVYQAKTYGDSREMMDYGTPDRLIIKW